MIELLQLKSPDQTFERAQFVASQRQEKVIVLRPVEGKLVAIYGVTPSGAVEEMQPEQLRCSFLERMSFQLENLLTVGQWQHKHQRERHIAALGAFGSLVDGVEELVKAGLYVRTKDGLVKA